MTRTIIAADCDGTLIATHDSWLNLYNRDYQQNLKNEDITHWGIEQFVVPECGNKIFDYLSYPELYEKSLPINGALEGINSLRQLGFKIKYLTSTVPGAAGKKKIWLEKWRFLKPEDEYHETDEKYLYPHDYLIDDNIDNCISSCGKGVLFTQPHNKFSLYNPRATGWDEVRTYFYSESKKWK
jgi:5'(3')-deoxyribonucleotidase